VQLLTGDRLTKCSSVAAAQLTTERCCFNLLGECRCVAVGRKSWVVNRAVVGPVTFGVQRKVAAIEVQPTGMTQQQHVAHAIALRGYILRSCTNIFASTPRKQLTLRVPVRMTSLIGLPGLQLCAGSTSD
jgi:hypothetical protein